MKLRSLFLTAICGLAVSTAITSCSDDEYDPYEGGSQVALPEHRGFVLNEGNSKDNNASISLFDARQDTTTATELDLYFTQNDKQLGSLGQDMIEYGGNIYVVVYGSAYIAKLNRSCVEQCRTSIDAEYGAPRYIVGEGGKLYVTSVGGYVLRLNPDDLSVETAVKVGKVPEKPCVDDGKLYVPLGNTYDMMTVNNKLAIVDLRNFTPAAVKYVEMTNNLQLAVENNGYVLTMSYGDDWMTTPMWMYDIKNVKAEDTGEQVTYMMEYDDIFLCVFSETDWNTYQTVNHFFTYDPATKKKTDVTEKVVAEKPTLATASIYSISEGKDDSFYLTTTMYSEGNGTVYHFSKDFKLIGSFTSWGQNPRKVVVI